MSPPPTGNYLPAISGDAEYSPVDALLAAKYGNHQKLRKLLSSNPSLVHTAKSSRGHSLLDYAVKYNHQKTAAVIRQFIQK